MKRRWHAVLLALVACGSGGDDGPSDMSPEGVCTYYAQKLCDADERCSGGFRGFWSDGATCRERVKLSCTMRLSAPGVNDTSSRILACANTLSAFSCDKYNDDEHWPDTCTPPPGQLADGTPCIVAGQCQGRTCSIVSGSECGVCRTVSPVGGACSDEVACFNFLPCVNGICTPHPRTGEPCDALSLYCVAGSVCRNVDAMGVGTCAAPLPQGAACEPNVPGDDECDVWNGYFCDASTKVCTRAPPVPKIGEPCGDFGSCAFIAYCSSDRICHANPREGHACLPGDLECMTPARCIDGMCKIRDAAVCK